MGKRLILISLIFLLELGALLVWVRNHTIGFPFLLHLFSVCLFGVILSRNRKTADKKTQNVYLYGAMLTLFFPFVGIMMALLLLIMVEGLGKYTKTGLYQEYEEFIEEKIGLDSKVQSIGNMMQQARKEVGFESFIDIIKGSNNQIKERVIEKLSKEITPKNIKLLKEAIEDSSAEIRLYAVGALLKLEEEINEKIQLAKGMVDKRGAVQDFSNLGNLYRMYASVGLIEPKNINYYLQLACNAYRQSLDQETNQPAVVTSYVQSLLTLKQYEKAKRFLDAVIDLWPNNKDMILLRNRARFALKDFEGIAEDFNHLKSHDLSLREKEIQAFWTNKV